MALILILIGLFMLVPAVKGGDNLTKAITLVKGDFSGKNSFVIWVVAIFAIGSIGYVKPLKPLSIALLTLLIVVIFLSNKGFFTQFQQQVQSS